LFFISLTCGLKSIGCDDVYLFLLIFVSNYIFRQVVCSESFATFFRGLKSRRYHPYFLTFYCTVLPEKLPINSNMRETEFKEKLYRFLNSTDLIFDFQLITFFHIL